MRMLSLERKRKELMKSGEAKGQMKIGFQKSLRQMRRYIEFLFIQHGRRPQTHIITVQT